MGYLNRNTLLIIFAVIVLLAVIYYINQDNQPIPNQGYVNSAIHNQVANNQVVNNQIMDNQIVSGQIINPNNNLGPGYKQVKLQDGQMLLQPSEISTRRPDDMSSAIVDDLIAQYSVEDRPMDGGIGSFGGIDPMDNTFGDFSGYERKRQLNMRPMEEPYYENDYDPRDFSYKKNKFSRRTPEDVKDLFDINKMLPQEYVPDWFDVEPLLTTRKIKGTHLIHPKVHMGVNTVLSSLRYGTHDLRGDIPNPKIPVSVFNNSTIEPDTNLKGLCNPM